ncbi:hypothetical protein [Hymenobacter elongatus]|uniref:HTH cro/C1-type domain-containing protein n=1 Tax=Hymenobacter elongatus TaxID=877208 RepID=A0A4Z0PNU2_9BACT|nr:hypothetical protein [Hymenobacter elongatus]TGE18948.1 hypothetical protein E5J99_04185 [Hymenobacter elongatus]
MRSPKTGNPMHEVEGEAAAYTFRGQQFQLSSPAWQCPDTGERYNTPEQGNVFLARLHRAWREQNGLSKDALHRRVEALGLSGAQVSDLLGFGINQYRTYVNTDKLPSKSNALLLKLLLTDQGLSALLAAAPETLKPAIGRKVRTHLALVAQPTAEVVAPYNKELARVQPAPRTSFSVTVPQEAGERVSTYSFAA